jgi:hemoglobin/transferrin/lactoferrin receptor protein
MIVQLRMEFAASSPCKDRADRPILRAGLMSGVALFILASALDARAQQTPAAPEPSATQPAQAEQQPSGERAPAAPQSPAPAQGTGNQRSDTPLPAVQVEAPRPRSARQVASPGRQAGRAPRVTAAPQPAPATSTNTTSGRAAEIVGPLGGQYPKPESLHQATQSITVVDRKEIELTDPTSTLDILAGVPGVSIARSGGIGGQIYLRGFSSNNMRSPLYIDGDRLHGRNTLQYQYFAPEEIERVEVIRGPASVLYGSDALTGLVNMIMRHPQIEMTGPVRPTGGGVSVGYGTAARSFSTYNWAQAGGAGFGILGGIGYRSGGDYNTPLGPAVNSDYRSVGGNLNIAYAPVADQRFELTLRSYRETDGRAGGVGGAPGYPFLNVRQSPNDLQMGRLSYSGDFFDGPLKHVEASVYANYFDTHLLTVNTSMPQRIVRQDSHVIGPLVLGGKAFGTFGWEGLPWGALNTTVGIDGWTEARPGATLTTQTQTLNGAGNVVSTVNTPQAQTVPDSGQSNVGAFVLNEWTPVQRLTLSAGGRYDWFNTNTELSPLPSPVLLPAYQKASSVDRTAPTGSFGLVYRLLPTLDLLANVSTAFRQPTNAELFNSTATQIPNPNLLPETGLTYEGGFRVNVSNATLKVTVFDSFYKNLILAVPVVFNNSSLFTQNQNVGDAEIQGVELEERWQVTPSFNIFGNLTALRGTNTTTNLPLPYISPLHGRSGVQYAPPGSGYSVMAIVDWASAKTRIDPKQEYQTAGYAVPSLYATLQLGTLISPVLGDTRLTLGLENIFDKAYIDAATFANVSFPPSKYNPLINPGRNFNVKMTHTF